MERTDLVENRIDVIKNIYTIYSYAKSCNEKQREWALQRFKQGHWYVVEAFGDTLFFAPSRFVGYKNNTIEKHIENPGDGIQTNKNFHDKKLYKETSDEFLTNTFRSFMDELGIKKDTAKFLIPYDCELSDLQNKHNCFFVSPTHCKGQKETAWKSFLNKNIMAIGWEHDDYTEYTIEDLCSEYWGDKGAVEAFTAIKEIKYGDIVCCTNNIYGLWGIGIAMSSYKHKLNIHYAGIDEKGNNSYYSHYVDVVWLNFKQQGCITTSELNINENENQWRPFGALNEKSEIPQYIKNYLLKNTTAIMDQGNNYEKYINLLKTNKNIILTGAPGTGKTYLAKAIADCITENYITADTDDESFDLKIKKYLTPNTKISSSKGNTTYKIDNISDTKVNISGKTIKPYQVSFKEIEKAYNQRLWLGGQKNGYDSYSSALAKVIYENENNSQTTTQSKKLSNEKFVELVQFHPSYDYTDFVEGLRPTPPDADGNIGFERKDGVFKAFCKRAITSNLTDTIDNFEECWQKLLDLLDSKNYLEIPLLSHKNSSFRIELNVTGEGLANRTYENDIYEKDTWIHGKSKFFSKDQLYNVYRGFNGIPSGGHDNYRKAIINYMKDKLGLRDFFKGNQNESTTKPYIFIIDEINRGEISKIFGELFFSIDPGYRGEKGRVKTQYQNMITDKSDPFYEGFYIPENVYIIGTMNDIDRSVESMDFAMRRRFAWIEIKAEDNTGMLDELADMKDDVLSVMKRLNDTIWNAEKNTGIEGLSTAYHIGGAYFSKLLLYLNKDHTNKDAAYKCLWENHLKGILSEYLRGSYNAVENLELLENAYYNYTDNDTEG